MLLLIQGASHLARGAWIEMTCRRGRGWSRRSLSPRGSWVEMLQSKCRPCPESVTLMGCGGQYPPNDRNAPHLPGRIWPKRAAGLTRSKAAPLPHLARGLLLYVSIRIGAPRRVWQGGLLNYIGCCVWAASRIHPTPCTAQKAAPPFSGTAPRKGPGRPGWPAARTRSSRPYSHPGRARTASKAPA